MEYDCKRIVNGGIMTAKSIGFAVAEEDAPLLEQLVVHFGHGNRSEFLRAAMKRMRHEMFADRMLTLQAGVREDLGGRVVSAEEVTERVRAVLAERG
jgi:Arc/MetJ-type ribon-helix-helix transcriptional regulator